MQILVYLIKISKQPRAGCKCCWERTQSPFKWKDWQVSTKLKDASFGQRIPSSWTGADGVVVGSCSSSVASPVSTGASLCSFFARAFRAAFELHMSQCVLFPVPRDLVLRSGWSVRKRQHLCVFFSRLWHWILHTKKGVLLTFALHFKYFFQIVFF